jgi:nitroreductase
MEVLDAIHRRRAVRDYTTEPVSTTMLEQVIAAASWAPSAMNEQPCRFTVVTDSALMARISDQAKLFMLASTTSMARGDHFHDLLSDPNFNVFYNAPALLIISAPDDQQWSTENCALAAQNAMLAAREMGLGSCWIGFAQGWLNSEGGRKALALPQGQRVVAPLILGHPKTKPPVVPRKKPQIIWIGKTNQRADPTAPDDAPTYPLDHPHSRGLEIWNAWEPFRAYPKACEPLLK